MKDSMKYSVINVTIPNGGDSATPEVDIKSGTVVACALFTDGAPSSPVNVKIDDDGNNEIHPSVSYKEYVPTNGNHFESRKPIRFKGNQKIKITASALAPLTADFTFQLLFYIQE